MKRNNTRENLIIIGSFMKLEACERSQKSQRLISNSPSIFQATITTTPGDRAATEETMVNTTIINLLDPIKVSIKMRRRCWNQRATLPRSIRFQCVHRLSYSPLPPHYPPKNTMKIIEICKNI